MVARGVSATPRRSTRSQSRELESSTAASSVDDAETGTGASTSLAPKNKSTAPKRARRSTKPKESKNHEHEPGPSPNGILHEPLASTSTIVEEAEDEGDAPMSSQTAVPGDETVVAEKVVKRARKSVPSKARSEGQEKVKTNVDQSQAVTASSALDLQPRARKARRKVVHLLVYLSGILAYLPAILIVVAVLLAAAISSPQKPFQRNVYVDENALQPGSANVEYSWADVEFADKAATRVEAVASSSSEVRAAFLTSELRSLGFTAHNQSFDFTLPDDLYHRPTSLSGINTYARWSAARGDGKEAFVISASWTSSWDGSDDPEVDASAVTRYDTAEGGKSPYERRAARRNNVRGIATVLSIARHLIAYRQWSKDLIIVFGDGEIEGMQAWTSAFFGREQTNLRSDPLHVRGALVWNALALDYPSDSFSHIEIRHEGLDGQLPNLDVISTLGELMHRAQNVPVTLPASSAVHLEGPIGSLGQFFDRHLWSQAGATQNYVENLRNVLRQVGYLSACHPSGVHGLFHRYHVDAITAFARPAKGPHGFYSMGRMVESMTRSMSNLLERLHHSHFFYLLTHPKRFIEVAKYLPVASLLSAALLLAAIAIWAQEGRAAQDRRKELISVLKKSIEDEIEVDASSESLPLLSGQGVNGGLVTVRALDDAALHRPTITETTQELIAVLLVRSERRGDLVGSTKIRLMAALLHTQTRPVLLALALAVGCHILGFTVFRTLTSAPVDCARNGIFHCLQLYDIVGKITIGGLLLLICAASSTSSRFMPKLLAVQSLLPDDALAELSLLRFADYRAVSRMLLMVAMLEAGLVTLIISIINFGLAVIMSAVLAFALCSARLPVSSIAPPDVQADANAKRIAIVRPTSPASDDSDNVDAMLPTTEALPTFGFVPLRLMTRARLLVHGVLLVCLTPAPALFASRGIMALIQRVSPSSLHVTHPSSLLDPVILQRLVDGALWDYHVLSSMLLPLLCGTYIPILLMGAIACFFTALSRDARRAQRKRG